MKIIRKFLTYTLSFTLLSVSSNSYALDKCVSLKLTEKRIQEDKKTLADLIELNTLYLDAIRAQKGLRNGEDIGELRNLIEQINDDLAKSEEDLDKQSAWKNYGLGIIMFSIIINVLDAKGAFPGRFHIIFNRTVTKYTFMVAITIALVPTIMSFSKAEEIKNRMTSMKDLFARLNKMVNLTEQIKTLREFVDEKEILYTNYVEEVVDDGLGKIDNGKLVCN